jgi:hypothetical protein
MKIKKCNLKIKSIASIASLLLMFAESDVASAFDTTTHAAMTSEAIKALKADTVQNLSGIAAINKKLGLYDKDFVIGRSYIDIGASLNRRNTTVFEQKIIDDVGNTRFTGLTLPASHTIPGWIIRGSIREDDNTIETAQGNSTGSGDEPGGVFQRVYGHFYDPVNDRPLTVKVPTGTVPPVVFVPVVLGPKSTEWALKAGTTIPYTPYANPVAGENHYNVPSAREAMWRALTLKTRIFNDLPLTNGNNLALTSVAAQREDERNAYWATMFRAVGDVVHLLQDAGQPQHTRNDAHSGLGCLPGTDTCVFGHASFAENYFAARTLQSGQFTLEEGLTATKPGQVISTSAAQLKYDGYAPPTFTHFSDYFSTDTGGGNASGKGLANYSNRGFFSFGTNIGNTDFPLPNESALTYSDITGPTVKDMSGNVVAGGKATITFRNGSVTDTVTGAVEPNVKLSTEGVFDQFLIQKGQAPRYTLNYYNYDDQARLLIPRAVAYSAGLIDYFFRGQMEVNLPAEGIYAIIDHADTLSNCKDDCGFKKIKAKVKNTTPPIVESGTNTTYAQDMTGGVMVAVAKFHRNNCYLPDLSGEYVQEILPPGAGGFRPTTTIVIQVTDQWQPCRSQTEEIVTSLPTSVASLAAGIENTFSFNFDKPIPINAVDLYLQIVYRGKLGAEDDAVAVQTIDISEPNYAVFAGTTGTGLMNFGSAYAISCSVVTDTWCRAAFIVGTNNYRGNFERCGGVNQSMRPRVSQLDAVTGVHTNTGIFRNYEILGQYYIYVSGRFQTTDCVDGTDISTRVVTPGFPGGSNSTSQSPSTVQIQLPPTKIPALNF